MKRCVITIKYDVTQLLPQDWDAMTIQDLKEFFNDTPEILVDAEYEYPPTNNTLVWKVEKIDGETDLRF